MYVLIKSNQLIGRDPVTWVWWWIMKQMPICKCILHNLSNQQRFVIFFSNRPLYRDCARMSIVLLHNTTAFSQGSYRWFKLKTRSSAFITLTLFIAVCREPETSLICMQKHLCSFILKPLNYQFCCAYQINIINWYWWGIKDRRWVVTGGMQRGLFIPCSTC